MGNSPVQVAIVGGGCAGVSAAFELTRPERQGRYHVTVYQMGWRLGGKGASGRGVHDRIEEHGLHLWMGFYENAFTLLRECYAELGRDKATCPIADWSDAFDRNPYVGVADRCNDGQWRPWTADFPVDKANPGDPLCGHNPFSVSHYFSRAVALLKVLFSSLKSPVDADHSNSSAADNCYSKAGAESILEVVSDVAKRGQLTSVIGLFEALQALEVLLEIVPRFPTAPAEQLLKLLRSYVNKAIQHQTSCDDESRRLWIMADIILACVQGAVRFDLFTDPRGFDAIDDYDWRDWLMLNGASQDSVDSAFMRGIYDLLFAYENGDISKPSMSAGQALRGAVRMFFSSRGAIFWKMKAGMGDVVFAPFYEVLKERGVTFRFFHRLRNVNLSDPSAQGTDENAHVTSLEFEIQAKVKRNKPYDPLVTVNGLPSWPAAPDYGQLEKGETLEQENRRFESDWDHRHAALKTLNVTKDFDVVVLAIGLGAIPNTCSEILSRNAKWREMVDNVATVQTQAVQLWMREDMRSLGWRDRPINLSGYVTPFDTWADMTHLVPAENWPQAPESIAYFCSVLPDNGNDEGADDSADDNAVDRADAAYPVRRESEVKDNCIRFLNNDIQHLWPGAVRENGEFRWDLLIDPYAVSATDKADATEERFNSQFWTANVNSSDRYVLSLPGTAKYRISPLDLHYDNLTVAGDWTECSHNAGCVEAAVMSGRLAAHAISGFPLLQDITGYDHP
jgi:uncharacterized protein with NAD-binding domain and iron-sulfur cluster